MQKILIVDDSKLINNILRTRLEGVGYNIESAFDGREATEKIREFNPDMVVLDLMLPKISGIEILKNICSGKYCESQIPTIVISSNDLDSYRRKSLELGAKAFIKKPFDLEEIESEIERYI